MAPLGEGGANGARVTSREARIPPLSRSALRRVAHRRTDAEWLGQAWERSKVVVVEGVHALVRDDRLVLLDAAEAPEGDRVFLGEDAEGRPYFAVFAPLPDLDGTIRSTIREIGDRLDDLDGGH